jgi:hypothetical protein
MTVSAGDADCLTVTVVDPDGGVADIVASDEPGDTMRAHLRSIGDGRQTMYVSVEQEHGYAFVLRVRRDGSLLVGWDVAAVRIARDVEAGRMRGRVDGDDVYLDALGPDVLARIAKEPSAFFEDEDVGVVVRVSGS